MSSSELEIAATASPQAMEDSNAHSQSQASAPALTEDVALSMLKRNDLPPETFEQLARNPGVSTNRKVRAAIASHAKTPRHISVPLLRQLFTFELMNVALTPTAPADVRVAAEEALINRLETISPGEKLSLARRASGRVASALLLDPEPRVMQAALENGRLTEASVAKALVRHDASAGFVQAVCRHPVWSLRSEVRVALLRNENTPLAKALEFAGGLQPALLTEILQVSKLPQSTKAVLRKTTEPKGCEI